MPFAVSGSCQILEVNGRRFRGRIYPWGVLEGKNERCITQAKRVCVNTGSDGQARIGFPILVP